MNLVKGLLIAILVLLLLIGLLWFKVAVKNNKIDSLVNDTTRLYNSWQACVHAPITIIDSTHTTTTVVSKDTVKVAHKPKKTTIITVKKDSTVTHKDSTITEPVFTENTYQETWTKIDKKDTLSITFSVGTTGCLNWYTIDKYTYPKVYVNMLKTVPVEVSKHIPKTHLGAYLGTSINNFNKFPGVQGGLWLLFKDKWGLQGGAMYLPEQTKTYGQLNILIFFK